MVTCSFPSSRDLSDETYLIIVKIGDGILAWPSSLASVNENRIISVYWMQRKT